MTEEIEFMDESYWEWFYSSKMRIKRKVLKMEREAAQRLSILLKESKSLHDQRFASDLEWLLTWKLKTDCCSELMWCDGVIFENIEYIGNRSVRFQGVVWIGPEYRDDLFKVPIKSTLTLRPSGKTFKNYCFKINYNGLEILAKRN